MIQQILERAEARARELGLPYAGAVTPVEAYQLHSAGAARIVDVRTRAELDEVGHFPEAHFLEWKRGAPNHEFVPALAEKFERDTPILFLCRSGVRSHHAAELARRGGFTRTYNVLEGFEGSPLGGWRAAGLPWKRS